ncbi:hypothetical protein FACS1894206_05490 [Deltaproteobacteria bacterium]|nr:hypothetical protein FACS1894206_05490 [Deltaproteobacteria bacterium]
MENMNVHVLYPGFSGKFCDHFYLGWGTFALIQYDGRNIMLDTGNGGARQAIATSLLTPYGITAADVDYVLLTHLHWDHASNVDMFPNATFVLSRKEWDSANSVHEKDPHLAEGCQGPLRVFNKILLNEDGQEILPNLSALMTPGHTPGSVSYVLHVGGKKWVLAGDAAKNRGELRTGEILNCANPEETTASLQKIIKTADRVLPGHDGWISIVAGEIIPEGKHEVYITYGQGLSVNGGQKVITISLD